MIRTVSRYILGCMLLACMLCTAARAADPANPVPAAGPDVIDDKAITKLIHDQAAPMIEAGRTVKMATLIEQLKKTSCSLKLPDAPKDAPSPEKRYEQFKRSVVVMASLFKCDKCNDWHVGPASGFVLTANGVCVTNYHVVDSEKRETLVAMTSDGKVYPVKAVLAASKRDDIAIVQVDGDDLTPAPLFTDAAVGSRVHVISHPDSRFYTYTSGEISRYFSSKRTATNGQGGGSWMAITADYARGSSGGPLFNDRGEVVGMVASTTSLYYENKEGKQENLQMVIKQCVPAANILKLIEK